MRNNMVVWKKWRINFSQLISLRKQLTFGNATTGFPAKWCLRNEHRNSILTMHLYPDLGILVLLIGWIESPTQHNQSEALPTSGEWRVISMEFLCSFLRSDLAGKPVVASPNVGCFLRLTISMNLSYIPLRL